MFLLSESVVLSWQAFIASRQLLGTASVDQPPQYSPGIQSQAKSSPIRRWPGRSRAAW